MDCSTKPFKDQFRNDLDIVSCELRTPRCRGTSGTPLLRCHSARAGVRGSWRVLGIQPCVYRDTREYPASIRESTLRLGCTRRSRVHGMTNVVDRPSRVAGNAVAWGAVYSVCASSGEAVTFEACRGLRLRPLEREPLMCQIVSARPTDGMMLSVPNQRADVMLRMSGRGRCMVKPCDDGVWV